MGSRTRTRSPILLVVISALGASRAGARATVAAPPEERTAAIPVPAARCATAAREVQRRRAMERVYDAVKTPYKYGVILRPGDGESVDCPNVFRHGGQLVHALRRHPERDRLRDPPGRERRPAPLDAGRAPCCPSATAGWDRWQADASLALVDPAWGGSAALQPFDGRYWISYFGGAKQGYEPDPLSLGSRVDARRPRGRAPWTRLEENPVLTPEPARRAAVRAGHALQEPRSLGQGRVPRLPLRHVLQRQAAGALDRAHRHGGVPGHGALVALRRRSPSSTTARASRATPRSCGWATSG